MTPTQAKDAFLAAYAKAYPSHAYATYPQNDISARGEVWDEAGFEVLPIAKSNIVAVHIGEVIVIFDDPDGHNLCVLMLTNGCCYLPDQDAQRKQLWAVWQSVVSAE